MVDYFFACRACGLVFLFYPPQQRPSNGRCTYCGGVLYDLPILNALAYAFIVGKPFVK